jgi:hypothetical protein
MPKHLQKKNKQKRKEKHMIKIFDGIITEEKTWKKKIFLPNLLCLVIEESLLRIANQ